MINRKYHEPKKIEKKVALKLFKASDIRKIVEAMVSVAYFESDWKWAQEQFLKLFNHPQVEVQSLAAICLGHLARIHGVLDKPRVLSILKRKAHDEELRGYIEDAISDINIFIP